MFKNAKTNFVILIPALAFVAAVIIFVAVNTETAAASAASAFTFLTNTMGWYYEAVILICFLACIILAFSPLGKKRLGKQKPEVGFISWLGLVFSVSGSAAIFIWGTLEPYYYVAWPAYNMEAFSAAAYEHSLCYSLFHWGIMPFSSMVIFGVIFGYYLFVRRNNATLPSMAMVDLMGERRAKGFWGKLCDIIYLVAILCGLATTLGLTTPVLAEIISYFTGIPHTYMMEVSLVIFWTACIVVVVFAKLTKGITFISNLRLALTYIFLILLFICGPTVFILNYSWESFGTIIQNAAKMSFYTGSVDGNTFAADWTVFYWAWFIAYSVSSGVFYARISRGRTLRQYILGSLFASSFGCGIIFMILSSTVTDILRTNALDYGTILADHGTARMIVEIWTQLPFHTVLMLLLLALVFISTSTFLINYSYTLAMSTTKQLFANNGKQMQMSENENDPAKWLRILWAAVLGALGLALMAVGGIQIVQRFTIIGSFPMAILVLVLLFGFYKSLKKHGWKYVRFDNDGAGEFIKEEDEMVDINDTEAENKEDTEKGSATTTVN